jgi:uncharacterized protein
MTPQERQLIDDLFDRLSKLESAPRDPDASSAIAQGLRVAPNAVYALVQTVLVQDEALKLAHHRIEELEAGSPAEQRQSGSFLDSMRDTVFGADHSQAPSRGSVPNVPPRDMGGRDTGSRPVWNSGQVLQRDSYQEPQRGPYPEQQYGQGQYGQPYGGPQGYPSQGAPMGGLFGGGMGGGGSFLGTAAAAAAGTVGGSLLLNSFRSMMGGTHQAFGEPTTVINEKIINQNPWSDQSGSSMARDAGINDIGSSAHRADDNSRSGLLDSTSKDDDRDVDHDDMDLDSDDFGGDGDSDYA